MPVEPPGFPAEIPSPPSLPELHAVMVRCTRCALFLSRTQVVPGWGPPDADVMLVGEAPGASEDLTGIPFVGRSGALLETMLAEAGLTRDAVFIANVVRCRPPANRCPRPAEIRACAGWLAEQIRLTAPRLVVTLGRFALQHFIPAGRITQLQGQLQPLEEAGRSFVLYPLLHPAAILRNPRLGPEYRAQFGKIREILKEPRELRIES